jgi:hypothetical protein
MRPTRLAPLLALLALAACGGPARVDLDPASLRFGVRGQSARVHATPRDRDGKALPQQICTWTTSDEKVATVKGFNDAEVTAVGPGAATVRCKVGDVGADVAVLVRVVARVTVKPDPVDLKVTDEPRPFPLAVEAFDDAGGRVIGRHGLSRCADENVCRGDSVPQLWAVGAGETTALVEVEGTRSEPVHVRVVDARSADAKPKRVTGNPMEAYEKEYQRRQKEAAAGKGPSTPAR